MQIPAKLMGQLFKAARETAQSVVEVPLPAGGRLRFRKFVSPAVSAQVEVEDAAGTQTVPLRVFVPGATRPSDYPASLPFLSETEVTISEAADATSASWKPSDPFETFEALRLASVEEGWTEDASATDQSLEGVLGMRLAKFRKADRRRALVGGEWPDRYVTLIDGPDRSSAGDLPHFDGLPWR